MRHKKTIITLTLSAFLLVACWESQNPANRNSVDGGNQDTETETDTTVPSSGWNLLSDSVVLPSYIDSVVTANDDTGHFYGRRWGTNCNSPASVTVWRYSDIGWEEMDSVERVPYHFCDTHMIATQEGTIAASCGSVAVFDGSSWSHIREDTRYVDVWGSPEGTVFLSTGGEILMDNGTGPIPTNGASQVGIFDMWGTSADDVYGIGYEGAFSHFDGTSWSALAGPQPAAILNSLWGAGTNEIYSTSEGLLHRYDGSSWSSFFLGNDEYPIALDGVGTNDVYVLTGRKTDSTYVNTLFHFDGTVVSVVDEQVGDISEAPILDLEVFDSGEVFTLERNMLTGVYSLEEVGGAGASIPLDPASFNSGVSLRLSGTASNDIHVLTHQGLAGHYDGTSWTELNLAPESGIHDVAGFGTSGGQAAIAYNGAYYVWDGSSWTVADTGQCNTIARLTGTAADDVYIRCYNWTGGPPHWYHYDGTGWDVIDETIWDNMYEIAFFEEDSAFGISYTDNDYYAIWNGSAWNMNLIDDIEIEGHTGFWGTGPDNFYTYQSGFSWTHFFDGNTWINLNVGNGAGINSLSGSSPNDVIAVQDEGKARHFDGQNWTSLDLSTNESLISVSANANGTAFILGDKGSVWKRMQ